MKTEREIRFRGFDKVNKRMFEVYGLGVDWVTENTMDGVNEGVNCWHGKDFTEKIEVMQYTGLNDKNGNHIYEGDIVKENLMKGHPIITEIVFGVHSIGSDDWGILHVTPCFCRRYLDGSGFTGLNMIDELEIIGNSFENPELIKN